MLVKPKTDPNICAATHIIYRLPEEMGYPPSLALDNCRLYGATL